ncbi:MAG: tRNA (adenosine(37)-N6)-dimethylallyltransferase MiaA [Melioribacteraceae bacterium]|nr:tRNA (adenosine(37)-N6)-dimethylallyltransferase MiaA [Melioribacteraceae bacterium]
MESKVVVIVGPTCSGKTELSLLLSKQLNVEIISADSRQIYKHLDIGTAKPSKSEIKDIKHHLIDCLEPDEEYNASKFEKDAISIIGQIQQSAKFPIVVGGSGLYIRALIDGIFDSVDTDEEFRSLKLEERKKYGNQYLFDQLKELDPKTSSTLLPQNWKRIIRALEVFHITGEPIWKHQQKYKRDVKINFLQFGINWDRETLYQNIEKRVDEMIKRGLVNEVKNILEMGYKKSVNSLNTVGYKEVIDFLENKNDLERTVQLIKRNSRRYAKRQMTWFRADKRIKWFDVKIKSDLEGVSQSILDSLKN